MSDFEEKVISLLEKIDGKLDKVLSSIDSGASSSSKSSKSSSSGGSVKPSSIIEEQEAEEREKEAPPVEGRRVCPECGGTDFKTQEDKSEVLYQQGGMKIYKKNHICKACGHIMKK